MDERLLATAQRLAALADVSDEQALSREALRLSDHEFDEAFASAIREAAVAAPAPPAGPLKQLTARIARIKERIAKEQAQLAKPDAAGDDGGAALELLKAQLALDQDELTEAQEDLARQGGDRRAMLERMLQEHEAADHATAPPKPPAPPKTGTLAEQILAWVSLSGRRADLESAHREAAQKAALLGRQRDALDKGPRPQKPDLSAAGEPAAVVGQLHRLSDQSKTLAELDKRIQDSQQLGRVYQHWSALIQARQRAVLHLILISLSGILAILLLMIVLDRAIRFAFLRSGDRRRMHQLRLITTIAVQVLGALLILFIIFGRPSQMSTIIGLTTAGLTVVLRDFIVAFFGWFALMGKSGIRIGDWVEIEGVSGEVIELGILKTVLMEMGNWTSSGHPTGRRVAFNNKFAIENHYFNFSTEGQWLWDELRMTLPDTSNSYEMAAKVRDIVDHETEADAKLAEQDWERVTRQYGMRLFTGKPAVDLRPSTNGLEVVVRYITLAPQRFERKSSLFQQLVELIHKSASVSS